MSAEPNIMMINGWGGAITSSALRGLWNRTITEFGRSIYAPPPVDYKETGLILRYLAQTKDPWIFVGLSCGCSTINAIANAAPNEPILHAFYYSPSMYCGVGRVPKNVSRATQVSSWSWDFFNPGSRQLIVPVTGNTVTKFNTIQTNIAHGYTPNSMEAETQLFTTIQRAKGK